MHGQKDKAKEQKRWFLSMLLIVLDACLLENLVKRETKWLLGKKNYHDIFVKNKHTIQ